MKIFACCAIKISLDSSTSDFDEEKSSKHKLIRQSLSTAILHNSNRDRYHSEKTCVIQGLVFSRIKDQTMLRR